MAKAKKSEAKSEAVPAAKAPAAKAPTKKTAKKPAAAKTASTKTAATKPAAPKPAVGVPLIDTNLAAASAAQMLLARKAAGNVGGRIVEQLKQDVARPHKALDSLFHSTAPKAAGHSHLPQQVQQNQAVRSQTKAAESSRANVPRRTAG